MTKPCKSYYSAAVGHVEVPGVYLGSFGLPGELPRWVTEGGKPKHFDSPEAAELAGFRVLAKMLNRAADVQEFHKRDDRPKRDWVDVPQKTAAKAQAKTVFKNFR